MIIHVNGYYFFIFMGKKKIYELKKELPDLFALLKVSQMAVINIDFKWGLSFLLERFSNDSRKTKIKAITPTNHNSNKQHDEPITIPGN